MNLWNLFYLFAFITVVLAVLCVCCILGDALDRHAAQSEEKSQ